MIYEVETIERPEYCSYRTIKKFAIYETLTLVDGRTVRIICESYYVLQEYVRCNPAFGYIEAWQDRKYALNADDFKSLDWTMVKFGIKPHPKWSLEG